MVPSPHPVEATGAMSSSLLGINDKGLMVRRYTDANGVHGMVFKSPHRFVTYDHPGAIEASFDGINHSNMITGRYTGGAGFRQGFLAQVTY